MPTKSTSVVRSGLSLLILVTAGVAGMPTNSGHDAFRELILCVATYYEYGDSACGVHKYFLWYKIYMLGV
jgi:hypothetical protein